MCSFLFHRNQNMYEYKDILYSVLTANSDVLVGENLNTILHYSNRVHVL